ncbi:MAG TPA: LD-carboxypeptidase [Luteibaculaceae bacterium]|nr:LD-carboxypeptidase [Luteibaculaceae bacterium]
MFHTCKPGDTVAIVATARKITRAEVEPAVIDLENRGYQVILGPNLFETCNQFAGTVDQRLEALQWALDHPDVSLIWCARGGYGTMQLMDRLLIDREKLKKKTLAGFSDITALHLWFNALEIPTVHSTMPLSWPTNTDLCRNLFFETIEGKAINYLWTPSHPGRNGIAAGKLMGGNLSLIYALMGTPYFPDLTGAILFLEDLDEYRYHIDRMMTALRLKGVLGQLAGLVVGGMTDMKDNSVSYGMSVEEIILSKVADYQYPVVFDAPAGHINNNLSLRFGVPYQLQVDDQSGKLTEVQAFT